MKVADIGIRRKGLAALTFLPPLEEKLIGAEYEKEKLLIDREILSRLNIVKGSQLEIEDVKQLVFVSECYRAKQKAIWHLSQSDHSEKALYEKLLRKFSAKAAAFAVEQMVKKGYLNDENYAVSLLEKLLLKNCSKREVKQKMFSKGLNADLIKQVMDAKALEETEHIRAYNVIMAKFLNRLDTKENIDKVVMALQRKGFDFADIKKALENIRVCLKEK